MSNYRRSTTAGASYFFTVVTWKRRKIFDQEVNINLLREAFCKIKTRQPFALEAIVILPDNLHCIWTLPDGDSDFSNRWREIKKYVTKRLSTARNNRNEGDVWQRRFWEHQIRDVHDWQNHMDYIHYNPVKYGYVSAPYEWKWSLFGKWVNKGGYELNWGAGNLPQNIDGMEIE